MSLKNKEIDLGDLKDKIQIINLAIGIFNNKYSKYFDEDDKGIFLKINNSLDSIKNELNKLNP